MLRSLRVRLVISFLLVVAVALGVAELIVERTTSREFNSYVSRTDAAYLETFASNLGRYYESTGGWQGVESIVSTLPPTTGFLQLQDASGTPIAESSPGLGPGPRSGPRAAPTSDGANPGPDAPTSTPNPGGPDPGSGGGVSPGGNGQATDATPAGNGDGVPRRGNPAAPDSAEGGSGSSRLGSEDALFTETQPGLGDVVAQPSQGTPQAGGDDRQERESVPIFANGEQVGTLVVLSGASTPSQESRSDFLSDVRSALLIGGFGALAVAFILAVALVESVTRPLRRLRYAAAQVAAGDFSHRVDIRSPAEAAQLADSFNRMSENLQHSQETRRRLLSDIVHELRSPLSVIQGTAQGFIDGVITPDEAHVTTIRDEVSLLSKLITDLRDLALAEAGELRLDRRPVDLAVLIEQAVTRTHSRAAETGVILKLNTPSYLPPALADPERTLQVIGNLLDNALRHTPSEGTITLDLGRSDGSIWFRISDTGEGIPPEHLPHIFERFYRADPARARGGTGLGLAIVKHLVEAQNGSVSVQSSADRGTSFTVRLPVATGATA